MIRKLTLSLVVIAALIPVSGWGDAFAQSVKARENGIKSAYLYNFAKFVNWPAARFTTPDTPLTFCVLGDDQFADILDRTIKGKTIRGRPLAIKRISNIDKIQGCPFLFIGISQQLSVPMILGAVGRASVLTVGEMDKFTEFGGIINLTSSGNRLRFEINLDGARRAGLKVSSQLLKLATKIRTAAAGTN